MAKIRYVNDVQKDFQKEFDFLCKSRPRWQVWSDFVHMVAYSISNTVDTVHREKRESEYLKIASRYNTAEMGAVSRLLAVTVGALETNPDQDFLGDLYMRLELGNEHAGQFFTPYDVSKMMAIMNADTAISEIERKGYISVHDCCVGGGAMLIAFANACKDKGVNYQNSILFVGQDIDHTVGVMAYIQLSLLGCPGYVVIGNSLSEPLTGDPLVAPMYREVYVTPMYYSAVWNTRVAIRIIEFMIAQSKSETHDDIPLLATKASKIPDEAVPVQMSIFDIEV